MEDNKEILNDHQVEAIKQFRRNLSDVVTEEDSDAILLKWLRAKNYHLEKSEILYRENLASRALHKADKLLETYKRSEFTELHEYTSYMGISKDGTPVRYLSMGRGDIRGFIMAMSCYEICRYCTFIIEGDIKILKEQSKKTGKEINEMIYVIDMENFSLRQCAYACVIETGLDLFRLLQDHYPEIWKYILIVNSPAYFYTVFNIFTPIFRHTFLQNVQVVSKDNTPELLLKYIDPEVLPAFLGGKRVDSKGSPLCEEFTNFGGIIPEKYYLRNQAPLLPTDPKVEDVWVSQRSCHNCPIVVREPGSKIRIEIRLEGGSIATTILHRKFGLDLENIGLPARDEYLDEYDKKCNVKVCSPCIKIQAHLAPIDDFCYAPWPGIYIFKFDNSGNWFTSRRIIYRFTVTPPSTSL